MGIEAFQFVRGVVAGHYNLFFRAIEGIKNKKKFILGLFSFREGLNVIKEKQVDGTVLIPKILEFLILNGIGEIHTKSVRGEVTESALRILCGPVVTDSVE